MQRLLVTIQWMHAKKGPQVSYKLKDSSDSSQFNFEINVGKNRMNFQIDSKSIEDDVIQIQGRSMSYPTFSGIDFKNGFGLNYP